MGSHHHAKAVPRGVAVRRDHRVVLRVKIVKQLKIVIRCHPRMTTDDNFKLFYCFQLFLSVSVECFGNLLKSLKLFWNCLKLFANVLEFVANVL